MCDKEFKELVKIAVEKLKDESVLKLLQAEQVIEKIVIMREVQRMLLISLI